MKTLEPPSKKNVKLADKPEVPASINLKKILLPTDFSDQSKKALQYAVAFAAQFGATIVPLHIVEPLPYSADFGYGTVTLQQPNELLLSKAREHLKGWGADTHGRQLFSPPLLRSGTPHHEIVVCAREIDADLIILATHGYSGLDHVLLGSVAERVVRHAPCPVLIVRQKEHEFIAAS